MNAILNPVDGDLLLLGVVGSNAYGLAHEGSDEDLLGVFAAPTRDVLGLRETSRSIVRNEPDVSLHELSKFVHLALKCNPTVAELLWLDQHKVASKAGYALIASRAAFLSTGAVRSAYFGYARAQFKKLESRGYEGFSSGMKSRSHKHARHMFRLLEQGTQLLETGILTVRVADPSWYLTALPKMTTSEIASEFNRRSANLDEIASVLPDQPDIEAVESLLVDVRLAGL